MADDTPNFPQRRRPGQTYQAPSQAELDAREDRARATDSNVKPRVDPRAANTVTMAADMYRYLAPNLQKADQEINKVLDQSLNPVMEAFGLERVSSNINGETMASVDKIYQDNQSKMQNNLDELAKTDRNLAFSVADALSDSVRQNQGQDKVEVKVDGKSTDIAETLAKALGQDTLNDIKALFSDKNFAFTDLSTGKTVAPSSNAMTADKIAEKSAPQTGQGV